MIVGRYSRTQRLACGLDKLVFMVICGCLGRSSGSLEVHYERDKSAVTLPPEANYPPPETCKNPHKIISYRDLRSLSGTRGASHLFHCTKSGADLFGKTVQLK